MGLSTKAITIYADKKNVIIGKIMTKTINC